MIRSFVRAVRRAHVAAVAVLVLSALLALPAWADSPSAHAAICERAILHGARIGGVPAPVLHAIALTETGRWQDGRLRPWPWAINREGRGYWFDSREEALAFAYRSVGERRPSFDMSCFQINYHWHGHNFPSLEAMVDPDTAAVYAARFLRELYAELGSWSAAAGAYHSRTPEYAQRYRARFDRILAGLGGAPLADAPPVAVAAATEPEPPRVIPTRRISGPRIITVEPDDARGAVEKADDRGIVRVTFELPEAPLAAGRRL